VRICIFGAGAVGSHFAVRLARAGHDVSCVVRGPHLDAIKANGLCLRVGNDEYRAEVTASEDPAKLGVRDIVISTLKATALNGLVSGLPPLIRDDATLISGASMILLPGIPPRQNNPRLTLYANADYQFEVGQSDGTRRNGVDATAGVSFKW
jgi:2-dehydropantoate 2-reductase